jgi:ATP-dependent Clp protease ATP-binding subunit ClpA
MYGLQNAGRVAFLARHEAAKRQSQCIETTDLLLALTKEKEVSERFLVPVKGTIQNLQPEPRGERVAIGKLAFSEECAAAFRFTAEEAAQPGQRTGPAHLLLGILRVENCAAAEVLRECGLTAAGVRAQLSHPPPPSDPEQGRNYV